MEDEPSTSDCILARIKILTCVECVSITGIHNQLFQIFVKTSKDGPLDSSAGKPSMNCWHPKITNGRGRKGMWFKIEQNDFKTLFKAITNTKSI